MMLGGSGSSMHFQIWKHLHFSMDGYKIDQKTGKVVSIVRDVFRVQGTCPKKGAWMFLMKEYQKNQKENRDGTYNQCIMGHCFQSSYQGLVHIPQKENTT